MPVRMDKPWLALDASNVEQLTAHLGVYQLANDAGTIVYIGVAGGRTLFGLKGELEKALSERPVGATQFRFEANMAYRTRHTELLQTYLTDHGELPIGNTDVDISRLGRIRPG